MSTMTRQIPFFVLHTLYIYNIVFPLIMQAAPEPFSHRNKQFEESIEAEHVDVLQDPTLDNDVCVLVTTSSGVRRLRLQRAPSVFHPEIQSISITHGRDKESALIFQPFNPEIQHLDSHFFHNPQEGSILSISKNLDGHYHVEGFLDYNTAIAPPLKSNLRHKRATRRKRHFIYKIGSRVDLGSKGNDLKEIDSGEDNLMNSALREKFDRLFGKDINIQQLVKHYRNLDRHDDQSIESLEDDDDDDDDDYKEVPSFFYSEESWKAHQRQAESRTNVVHDKSQSNAHFFNGDKQFQKPSSISLILSALKQKGSHRFRRFPADNLLKRAHISRSKRDLQHEQPTMNLSNVQNKNVIVERTQSPQTESPAKQVTTIKTQSQIPQPPTVNNNKMLNGSWRPSQEATDYPNLRENSDEDGRKNDELRGGQRSKREKRQIPIEIKLHEDMKRLPGNTVQDVNVQHTKFTIEVHAVVDASLYREFNYNWKALQIFILHFWQSVNSRFQALINPQVQLKIKVISKIMFPGFQSFVENNRIKSDWVDVDNLLEDFKLYVQGQFELNSRVPDHDVVFLMTGEDLCKKKADGSWSKKSRGIAYVRGACISARRFQNETYDVGIAEVGRSFSGVLTTTHELAHLLGAFHDGEKSATSCPSSSGFIMGSTWNDPIKFNHFSTCSKNNMKRFIEGAWYSKCLEESVDHKNSVKYVFPKDFAGQVFSLEEQCFHFIDGVPCKDIPLPRQCGQLCCEKWSQVFKSREPAADGTTCGDGKMCQRGKCILETSNG